MQKNKKEPIRVLHMIASLYYGGSQAMLMNLYKKIDRTRVQFDFIVDHKEYDSYLPMINEMGGKVFYVPTFNGFNIKEVKNAWNKLFDEHPEYKVLHSHSRSYASIYLPIAKKHGLKTIIHSHNTSNGKGIKAFIKNIMQYPLRYQSDYYIGCSKDAGRWLFGNKIVNSNKFMVLNNAVDVEKYKYNKKTRQEYRRMFNLEDELVFIQVGSFAPQKNQIFTINVFEKVLNIIPNSKLFFVGVGDLRDNIEREVNDRNMRNNVFFLGKRSDVNCLLQMSDCYLMPSLYEGLSVAAVEAQASGIKCILSDNVSKDVCISSVCNFVKLDEEKWFDEMIKEITRKNTCEEIKKNGFDSTQTAELLTNFYEEIFDE